MSSDLINEAQEPHGPSSIVVLLRSGLGALSLAWAALVAAQAPASRVLPPPEDFIKQPQYRSVSLSPDGRMLAALIPVNGRSNLALVDLEKHTAIALTGQTDDDVYSYQWLGRKIIQVTTADLDEAGGQLIAHQFVLIDVEKQRPVFDLRKVSRYGGTSILGALNQDGTDMIIETADRSYLGLDAYRFTVGDNNKKILTFESPGDVQALLSDRAGQVRIAVSVPRGGQRTMVWHRRSNDDQWTLLRDQPSDDITFDPIAFDFDNRTLYVRVPSKEHRGLRDVFAFDTETGQFGARIFEAKSVDAGAVIPDWTQRKIVGVYDGSNDGVTWLDPGWKQIQRSIDQALPGAHNHISWAKENADRVLVSSESETHPQVFYLLDRKTMSLERVGQAYPGLDADELSPRRAVQYKARDGLTIPAFLTMPKHPDGAKPPLIVVIHGGPFAPGDRFGYDGEVQFLASRGYAVLQPNFRGSLGYGDAFYKAGLRQYGLAMQDDVTDGVKWLIDTGKVDGDRVCLYGASYGGYATLWGLEKEPTLFRCGVAFLAVSDLEFLFDVTWSDFQRIERGGDTTTRLTREVGDPATDRPKMRAVSPDRHADRIQAPLLLAYGANDQRVPLTHGLHMRSALDDAHKEYEWVVYNNQKHTQFDPANRADFYRRVELFLAKNLAPRPSPTAAIGAPAPQ